MYKRFFAVVCLLCLLLLPACSRPVQRGDPLPFDDEEGPGAEGYLEIGPEAPLYGGGWGMPSLPFAEADARSYRQINETLAGLGITGLTDEGLEELEEIWQEMAGQGWAAGMNKAVLLLDAIGSGYYPLAEEGPGQVYSFDVEFWDIGEAYGRVLAALGGISGGELVFTDITEVEVEAKTGDEPRADAEYDWDELVWRVRYTLNGRQQVYLTEYGGDWFDTGIFGQINRQLAEEGTENRVWLSTDDYQQAILLYGSSEWAERLVRKTGIPLWPA